MATAVSVSVHTPAATGVWVQPASHAPTVAPAVPQVMTVQTPSASSVVAPSLYMIRHFMLFFTVLAPFYVVFHCFWNT